MSIIKIHKLAVAPADHAELEKRFAARIGEHAPGYEGFELWRPYEEGADYYAITRWADEESYRAYAAARGSKDPSTVVSHDDGVESFELVFKG
ncbi:MAG: antibiotic biosynthesis monooxygenase [Rothia sp. (in: high G+C Gram-positive bacteria)]|uniref:antibiotic biosynthesis monooxygenase family protein n=1 Tax=Rothia sp. (in: high G+C Gram-positive bacteria) TaxID=1885016 RepID=UPI0026E0A23D|nr:antibiotic biosynthesis monooxygenase [Rothia sp. (in: high G+C Gram-positive bacteria)]MDO5750921.1 antibiotic biosynthesis monooxygenase [Rothia sp. (in: high G+C Gram-positive bacteria)]